MTKKSTKSRLLLSVLALMMSLSMFAGSTFAWFTDSVSSVNNIIKSGNLDVVLEYKTDWADEWKVVGEDPIFNEDALYEPGYVETVFLRISNAGSLALKYDLSVSIVDEIPGTNVYGESFKLSDSLQIGAYSQAEYNDAHNYADILMPFMFGTREAAKSNITNFTKLSAVSYAGTAPVLPDETSAQVMALVLTMPEAVGNEANYKTGTTPPQVILGVNLFATQLTHESDSFGPDYDTDAALPPKEPITSSAELDVALSASGNYELGDSVETSAVVVPQGTTVNLDLKSESITANAPVENYGSAAMKDGSVNSTQSGKYGSYTYENAESVYENVDLVTKGGGLTIYGKAVFRNGSITTNSDSTGPRHVFYVDGSDAELIVEGGTFTFNPTNLTRKGSYLCANNGATVVIKGGTFGKPSTRTAPIQALNGATVTIYGGTFRFDPSVFVADGYEAVAGTDGWWTVSAVNP